MPERAVRSAQCAVLGAQCAVLSAQCSGAQCAVLGARVLSAQWVCHVILLRMCVHRGTRCGSFALLRMMTFQNAHRPGS